ncbi:MAG: hypothetical protein ACK4UJ_01595 [Leptonema sp. (in: bacteria)]
MEFTIYSDIFQFEGAIFIVELYRKKEEIDTFKITRVTENKQNNQELFLSEPIDYPYKNFFLIIEREKTKKIYIHPIKKDLTFLLGGLERDKYTISLMKEKSKKKILKLKID